MAWKCIFGAVVAYFLMQYLNMYDVCTTVLNCNVLSENTLLTMYYIYITYIFKNQTYLLIHTIRRTDYELIKTIGKYLLFWSEFVVFLFSISSIL